MRRRFAGVERGGGWRATIPPSTAQVNGRLRCGGAGSARHAQSPERRPSLGTDRHPGSSACGPRIRDLLPCFLGLSAQPPVHGSGRGLEDPPLRSGGDPSNSIAHARACRGEGRVRNPRRRFEVKPVTCGSSRHCGADRRADFCKRWGSSAADRDPSTRPLLGTASWEREPERCGRSEKRRWANAHRRHWRNAHPCARAFRERDAAVRHDRVRRSGEPSHSVHPRPVVPRPSSPAETAVPNSESRSGLSGCQWPVSSWRRMLSK